VPASIGNANADPSAPPNALAPLAALGGSGVGSSSALSGAAIARGRPIEDYALRGIYFPRAAFRTPAECLTAAYARRLPLDLCR
jgi:hypothetical protein